MELAQLLRFDPIPMILAEVFCANLGGAATMCGDPPNIIIGTSLGYSFGDFIANIGVIAGVCLIATLVYFYLVYHKKLRATSVHPDELSATVLDPKAAIQDKTSFTLSWVVFVVAILLLVTHAYTGLTVALIGAAVGLLTLLTSWRHALDILKDEVGKVFAQVLEDAGVYKCTQSGRRAFLRFLESVGGKANGDS